MKSWLNNLLNSDDEQVVQRTLNELSLAHRRIITIDGFSVDYMSYLKKSTTNKNDNSDDMSIDGYSDGSSVFSEDGHNSDQDEDPTIKIESQNTFQSGATDGVIDLSDSDDDDEGEEDTDTKHIPTTTTTATTTTTVPTSVPITTKTPAHTYMFPVRIMTPSSTLPNRPNHTPFPHLRGKLTGRAALKQTLMKRVVIASKENLCKQMNIKTNMLALYQEIVDKCRYILLYYCYTILYDSYYNCNCVYYVTDMYTLYRIYLYSYYNCMHIPVLNQYLLYPCTHVTYCCYYLYTHTLYNHIIYYYTAHIGCSLRLSATAKIVYSAAKSDQRKRQERDAASNSYHRLLPYYSPH